MLRKGSFNTIDRVIFVGLCRDDASRTTNGLPSAADAPSQRSELAKSAVSGINE